MPSVARLVKGVSMPKYEYVCEACGTHFEVKRHFGEPPPETCPKGHRSIRRVFVAPPIIFKGSGFYVTDHGHNGASSTLSKTEKAKSTESVSEQGD